MANIYVRVPHYIAAYLRNRCENESLPVGQPIRIEMGDPWYIEFVRCISPNLRNVVNIDCITERQWITMRQGKSICSKQCLIPDIPKKKKGQPLTISEIYSLCGKPDMVRYDKEGKQQPDTEYPDEYVAFAMPRYIVYGGKESRLMGDWYLYDASGFVDELRMQFKMVFAKFVAADQYRSNSYVAMTAKAEVGMAQGELNRKRNRSRMESIDRFMLRYDIRYGDRERASLKKILMRDIKKDVFALDSNINMASWLVEHRTENELNNLSNTARRVMVLETGLKYESIGACVRGLGCADTGSNRSFMTRSIRSGNTFHGFHIVYDDIEEPEQVSRAEPDKYVLAMRDNAHTNDQQPEEDDY